MPDVILRHRALRFRNFSKEWRSFNTKQIAQVAEYARQQFVFIQLQQLRLQRAANKCSQQCMTLRRSARKLHTAKGAGNERSFFNKGHDEAETVQRMRNIVELEAQVDCGAGSVRNFGQRRSQLPIDGAE